MSVRAKALCAALPLAAAALWGCSSSTTDARVTRGEVFEAVLASTAPDDDGDGLPNDVERRFQAQLGTNPEKADSDGDHIDDGVEVFGPGWIFFRSRGQAGALQAEVAAGTAGDAARLHGSDLVDSDGDGVTDYLEYAGYRYDWTLPGFVLDPAGYHTDPLQWSTDQDAYGDGQEVSGLNMDPAVRAPGNHPLVPAYPDIVLELTGYSVTMNAQITDGRGGFVEKGETWSSTVSSTHSFGSETAIGVQAGFSTGKDGGFQFGVSLSQSWTSVDTYAQEVTTGGSLSQQVNWDRARSYNPSDAARLRLLVRVHNRGTAPASNLVPTVNVRVGGDSIATFETSDLPIHMLLPGGAYPPDAGTSVVLDHDGAGNPLRLTDADLRAMQMGAPITVAVVQKKADVLRLDPTGTWQQVGDVNEYLARIVSVSASLFLDVGKLPGTGEQARLAQRLVYAGQGPTAPRVTLADALGWTDGLAIEDGSYTLQYARDDGTAVTVPLEAGVRDDRTWRLLVDPATNERNWPYGARPASLEKLFALSLAPGARVSLRAPRPEEAERPLIHTAYALPTDEGHEIVACASDYDAVARVVFVDKDGREREMRPDGRGPWFFSTTVQGYGFSATGEEVVRVESQRKVGTGDAAVPLSAVRHLEVLYTPAAQPPIIRRVTYDNGPQRLYARVEPGGTLAEDEIDWVWLVHPDFKRIDTGADRDGYLPLERPVTSFEDPYGWEAILPAFLPGMRLVAHTAGGRYASRPVDDMANLAPFRDGSIWLYAQFDTYWDDEWWVPEVDVEGPLHACAGPDSGDFQGCLDSDPRLYTWYTEGGAFDEQWPSNGAQTIWDAWRQDKGTGALPDLYLRCAAYDRYRYLLAFHAGGMRVEAGDLGTQTAGDFFLAATRSQVLGLSDRFIRGHAWGGTAEPVFSFDSNAVFLFRTDAGRLGKAIVRDIRDGYGTFLSQKVVKLDFAVFRELGDGTAPEGLAYRFPDAIYAAGTAIRPNTPTYASTGGAPDQYRLCAAAGTPCLAEDPSLLPAGLTFDAPTGAITGLPQARSPRKALRLYAWNTAPGEASAPLWITVLAPPGALTYPAASVRCATGYACTVPEPTVSGDADAFDVAPRLPDGLVLNRATGALSGKPAVVTGEAAYVITASNQAGSSTTTTLWLSTPLGAPADVRYPQASYALVAGKPIAAEILPTQAGGAVAPGGWSAAATTPLPSGVELDVDTGRIWGTPGAAGTFRVTVWARNAAGSASGEVTLVVSAP